MKMKQEERDRINAQGFTFIARGLYGWGEGETPELALSRAKKESEKGFKITLFRCSTNAFVDEYGTIKCDPNWEPRPKRDFIEEIG